MPSDFDDGEVASAVEKLKRLSYGPEDPRRIVANMLESLSRQNAELRAAWAKVRAEIEAEVGGPDLSRSDGMFQALQSDLAAANAKIAELEGRLASLTSVSEDDVERVAKAMFVSVRKDIPWAKVPSTLRTTWLEYTRATLITFVSR